LTVALNALTGVRTRDNVKQVRKVNSGLAKNKEKKENLQSFQLESKAKVFISLKYA
jgi:hypothetical protein